MNETNKLHVLIIDDEADVRNVVGLALGHRGWQVEEASNGREGLEKVRQRIPNLILVDLMMPQMSGIEFCHKLAPMIEGRDISILLVSGVNKNAKILNDFWTLPVKRKDFLHKPFEMDELLQAIEKIVPDWMSQAPATAPKEAATPPPKTSVMGEVEQLRGGYRILVIDDDPDIRTILKTTLELRHTVETADNGMEGLKRLDPFCPDFVITDINMPVMNGLETAKAIRRHPVFHQVPLFFLTGETDKNLPRKAYDIGGNLYLKKPIDPVRLLKYIDFFLKETKLEPGQFATLAKAAQSGKPPTKTAPPKAAESAAGDAVRILIVDADIKNHQMLKRLLTTQDNRPPKVAGGPFELLWAEDAHAAKENLSHWEPDLILYNVRNPRLDGVGFGQTIMLQKKDDGQRIVFIGARFYDAETEYSRRHWNRDPIDLGAGESSIAQQLGKLVAEARKKPRPKRHTFREIESAEVDRLSSKRAEDERQQREHEVFHQRYANVQRFIDQQFID